MTCSPIEINGESMHKFACVMGHCQECKDSYKPLAYEAECLERIKYCLYVGLHQCTWHGDGSIDPYDDDNGEKNTNELNVNKCLMMRKRNG